MAKVTGGELVVRTLLQAGIKQVFTLYGGHLETIFQAIREHGVGCLDVRHEVAAGHAAEGYARATRGPAVAMVTAGPGITNVVTSITNAWLDHTPVIYISASAPLHSAETNMVQGGFDQVALVKPITKWAHRVTATRDIPRMLAQAIRVAMTTPTGPVLLDLPIDVSFAAIDEETAPIPLTILTAMPAFPPAGAAGQAVALLTAAQRPVIMVGEGAWRSGAADELRHFVEASGIPAFADYTAHGLLPADHPLYAGSFYKMLALSASDQRPDVVLALGVRFGVFTLGATRLAPADACVIHVEADPAEIGRIRDVTLPVVADSRAMLQALNVERTDWPDWSVWQQQLQQAKAALPGMFAGAKARRDPPIHPYQAAAAVIDAAAEGIIVADGAEAAQWIAEVVRPAQPGRFYTHGHMACLGFGLGFAMGVQVAHPGERVICVHGDGGVGLTIAEFDTMARHGLPIVVVVMNNRSWGATRHWQDAVSGPGKNIAVDLGDARYQDVAAAFGCHAEYVTHAEQLAPALARALASGKPACVNIEIELSDMPPDALALMSHS